MGETPDRVELLRAVRQFVDRDLLPELSGVRRFHALVASNVLGIVLRELELAEPQLRARHGRLSDLLQQVEPAPSDPKELEARVESLEQLLCEQIRAGAADASPFRSELLDLSLIHI